MKISLALAFALTCGAGFVRAEEKPPVEVARVGTVLSELKVDTVKNILGDSRKEVFQLGMEGMLQGPQKDEFWKIFAQYDQERSSLVVEAIKTLNDYVAQHDTLDGKQAMALVKRSQRNQRQSMKIRDRYTDLISRKLDGVIAARFYQIDDMVNAMGKLVFVPALAGDKSAPK